MKVRGKVFVASACALASGVMVVPAHASDGGALAAVHGRFNGIVRGHNLIVVAYALPTASALDDVGVGGRHPLYRLPASAVSVSGGSYALSIAPGALPADVRGGEGVTFQVIAQDPQTGAFGVTTVTAPTVTSKKAARTLLAWARPSSTVADGGLVEGPPKPGVARGLAMTRPASTVWGATKDAWATIGSSFPASGQVSWMVYETSSASNHRTEGGIALSYKRVGGSYHQNGTKTVSGSFGFNWDPSRAQRHYRVGLRYRHATVDLGPNPTTVRYLNEWVPMSFNGGTNEVRRVPRPHWNRVSAHCTGEAKGYWHRGKQRGRDWDKRGGIHLPGISVDLTSRHAYNRSIDLVYHSLLHQKLCGNNAVPSRAGAVMQLPR